MSIEPHIQSFSKYLLVQKQRSSHTILNYVSDIRQWAHFCNKHTQMPSLTPSFHDVTRYIAHLHHQKLSPRSRHRKLSALEQFWEYLMSKKITKDNPWSKLRRPKIAQKIPSFIDQNIVLELLNNYPTNTPENGRNKAILELLFVTGIRVSECAQLNLDDMNLQTHECRIHGKGDKERLVLFGNQCAKWMQRYIEHIRINWRGLKTNALFLSKQGFRITTRTIQRIVHNANQYHSSQIVLTPHACRHSCASMLLTNGAGIRDIQTLLGHSSIATTQRYAHLPTHKLTQRFLSAIDEES